MLLLRDLVVRRGSALLCDADGNLFPSEEPAFEASAIVTNRLVAQLGSDDRFTAEELRTVSMGKNFRSLAQAMAARYGATLPTDQLEQWVAEENRQVTDHLSRTLVPVRAVLDALDRLAQRFSLAVVSSSALSRLAVCFTATGLDAFFPVTTRYSAQDSLPSPTSKPDPAVYLYALNDLGLAPGEAIAVEDAVAGVAAAVGAGLQTVGNLAFVPVEQRPARARVLAEAGAAAIVDDWDELDAVLTAAERQVVRG